MFGSTARHVGHSNTPVKHDALCRLVCCWVMLAQACVGSCRIGMLDIYSPGFTHAWRSHARRPSAIDRDAAPNGTSRCVVGFQARCLTYLTQVRWLASYGLYACTQYPQRLLFTCVLNLSRCQRERAPGNGHPPWASWLDGQARVV
jgi:hypothetical protein